MRVLLTGAAGRIGRAIGACLAQEHEVLGLDLVAAPCVQYVGDVADAALLRRALHGVQAVVHAAALHAPDVGRRPDAEFERVNVQATASLLDQARAAGVGQIVYTSTTALYGAASTPAGRAGWVDEALEPAPRTVYHRTKLAAEALLTQDAQAGGPRVRILRIARCFPEPAPLMAVYRLHRGVDARDIAHAHALALQPGGPAALMCLVAAATPFQREDAAALTRDAPAVLRRRAPGLVAAFAQRRWPLPASIDRVYDGSAARSALGFVARYGFEEVLRQADAGSSEVLG